MNEWKRDYTEWNDCNFGIFSSIVKWMLYFNVFRVLEQYTGTNERDNICDKQS